MRFTTSTVVAALPFLVAAAPRPTNNFVKIPLNKRFNLAGSNGVADIPAIIAHLSRAIAKINLGFANYEKNTGVVHPSAKGLQKRGSGAVALTDENRNEYWQGNIAVGTPPVTYTVDFDTGSSDLFLPGPKCDSTCSSHTIYNPGSSSTSNDLGKTFSLSYGDGSTVSGEQYTDTVEIAGLTATGQTLGAATQYSTSFTNSNADGLMGMGYQSISKYGASPVFQTLVSEGQVDSSVFAFKLATSGSELYIGGTDSSLYTGSFSYVPVTTQGYWQVTMDSVTGNGQTILSNVDSIIDTGTTLIVGNTNDVAQFYQAIGGTDASSTVGAGFYSFPCSRAPSVSFTFGGTAFAISPSAFNLGTVSSGSSDCVGAIMASTDQSQTFWIIGDAFLTNVYTVFDYSNNQVGFATLA